MSGCLCRKDDAEGPSIESLTRPSLRGGADKSLARPVMKQATATKLGIYSTCSPTKLNTLLSRCSNFCKALKKKFRMLSVQPGLRVGRKMATFQLFFQSREQAVVGRGQIRRIGCVIKILEAQVGQCLLCCKCLEIFLTYCQKYHWLHSSLLKVFSFMPLGEFRSIFAPIVNKSKKSSTQFFVFSFF